MKVGIGLGFRCYRFSSKGLDKCIRDIKGEKSGRKFDVVFWVVMSVLCWYGVMKMDTLVNMVMCSGVSKGVRWIMG
jgi:hypothetical protein